ncbi:hypothetical protein [Methanococcoides sp. NM1]|uniref:hypothetical protein n=1 Tax=Methanococcoides sp. NM1 TaxID=1201013 RepID=UPI00108301E9|nr:hypothetical protein [Methanococcoides sp. NM1]
MGIPNVIPRPVNENIIPRTISTKPDAFLIALNERANMINDMKANITNQNPYYTSIDIFIMNKY